MQKLCIMRRHLTLTIAFLDLIASRSIVFHKYTLFAVYLFFFSKILELTKIKLLQKFPKIQYLLLVEKLQPKFPTNHLYFFELLLYVLYLPEHGHEVFEPRQRQLPRLQLVQKLLPFYHNVLIPV